MLTVNKRTNLNNITRNSEAMNQGLVCAVVFAVNEERTWWENTKNVKLHKFR